MFSKWLHKNHNKEDINQDRSATNSKSNTTISSSQIEYVDSKKIKSTGTNEGEKGKEEIASKLKIKSSVKNKSSASGLNSKGVAFRTCEDEERGDVTNAEPQEEMHVKRRTTGYGSTTSFMSHPLLQKTTSRILKDPYHLTCLDRYLFRFCSAKKSFQYSVLGVRKYMESLDNEWNSVQQFFQWPKLPGGQHKKAQGFNYLSHSIWILAYASGTAYAVMNDKEEFYRECYEDILVEAEKLGTLLKDFFEPVNDLEIMYSPFEQMAKILNVEAKKPAQFGVDSEEIIRETLIPDIKRFRMKDFFKLRIYSRNVKEEEWVEFIETPYEKQMEGIQMGLQEIQSMIKMIVAKVPEILSKLKNVRGTHLKRAPSLFPHILKMQNCLKDMFRTARISYDDELLVASVFETAQEDIMYIIDEVIYFLTNVWEIILMVRLAYVYVQEGPNNCGTMLPAPEVMVRAKVHAEKRLGPEVDYKWANFYDVDCPALLRKVPVFVGNSLEMGIHLEGFSNPERVVPVKKTLWQRSSKDLGKPLIPKKKDP